MATHFSPMQLVPHYSACLVHQDLHQNWLAMWCATTFPVCQSAFVRFVVWMAPFELRQPGGFRRIPKGREQLKKMQEL